MDFQLPPGVTVVRKELPGGLAYVFRDIELGELGRLRVQGTDTGETMFTSEVAGDPDDPMLVRRQDVLAPLCQDLMRRMRSVLGQGRSVPPESSPPTVSGSIACKEVRCEVCGAMVAFLIFADDASDRGYFEDCARGMFAHYARHNVPTYIIGPSLGGGPPEHRPADVLQVWPVRRPIERLRPADFNSRIDDLTARHCA